MTKERHHLDPVTMSRAHWYAVLTHARADADNCDECNPERKYLCPRHRKAIEKAQRDYDNSWLEDDEAPAAAPVIKYGRIVK